MSVDTANKRYSLLSLAQPNRARLWPVPDGSFANQGDRQHLAYLYAGVLTAAAVTWVQTTAMALTGVGH